MTSAEPEHDPATIAATLFEMLRHGTPEHQAWLQQKINEFFGVAEHKHVWMLPAHLREVEPLGLYWSWSEGDADISELVVCADPGCRKKATEVFKL